MNRTVAISLDSPDPTSAINAFLWNMNKARSLGFAPKSEHMLAEHLLREDVKLIFYSSAGGIVSLCGSEDILGDDDAFEILMFVAEKRRAAIQRRKAAEAITGLARALRDSDGSGEAGETAKQGSTEGDSAGPKDIARKAVP